MGNSTATESATIRLTFDGKALAQLSKVRGLGGYKDLGEVVLSALALKELVDEAFLEGYSILVMQTQTGKQRRMKYHP